MLLLALDTAGHTDGVTSCHSWTGLSYSVATGQQ
jgi:hypothetical protein